MFANPLWPFTTPLHVPKVSLESWRIVERHVNALILASYLASREGDIPRMTAGEFFDLPAESRISVCKQFLEWYGTDPAIEVACLHLGLRQVTQGTALAGLESSRLMEMAIQRMEAIREAWCDEVQALTADLDQLSAQPGQPPTPAELAIKRQLSRIRGEYLLGELAAKGFLPGYGFPTQVVPFITTTLKQLRHNQQQPMQRVDNRAQFRSYPSRSLSLALREYAPGAEVVVDGRVYRSEGLSLSWHLPPGPIGAPPQLQKLRYAWRCHHCGRSRSAPSPIEHCPSCDSTRVNAYRFIEPAGFAVDLMAQLNNNVSHLNFVPVQEPWIDLGNSKWIPFPDNTLGRYRHQALGHVFHWSAGLHDKGFALCMRCGRSDPETNIGGTPPASLTNHYRLRGGKDLTGFSRCAGNDQDWAIMRNVWLGAESYTDFFELQILDAGDGNPIQHKAEAYSIAVALRQGVAETLGIETRELGMAVHESRLDSGSKTWAILLYDQATDGAGYVQAMAEHLRPVLEIARRVLRCPRACDAACHGCLLDYDTQHQIDFLQRHDALKVLNERFLDRLQLPSELCFFGIDSVPEPERLDVALSRVLKRTEITQLRVFLQGEASLWDLDE